MSLKIINTVENIVLRTKILSVLSQQSNIDKYALFRLASTSRQMNIIICESELFNKLTIITKKFNNVTIKYINGRECIDIKNAHNSNLRFRLSKRFTNLNGFGTKLFKSIELFICTRYNNSRIDNDKLDNILQKQCIGISNEQITCVHKRWDLTIDAVVNKLRELYNPSLYECVHASDDKIANILKQISQTIKTNINSWLPADCFVIRKASISFKTLIKLCNIIISKTRNPTLLISILNYNLHELFNDKDIIPVSLKQLGKNNTNIQYIEVNTNVIQNRS